MNTTATYSEEDLNRRKQRKKERHKQRLKEIAEDPEKYKEWRAYRNKIQKAYWDKRRADTVEYKSYCEVRNRKQRETHSSKMASDSSYYDRHMAKSKAYARTENGKRLTRKHVKKKRETCPEFKLAQSVRNRIANALKNNRKFRNSFTLVGCSQKELRVYLESQFSDGMSWANYGLGVKCWTVDHKAPCASFDLSTEEGQMKCFHFSNMQPMWYIDNCRKNSIVDGVKQYYSTHQNA